jgi:peptidoglycan-associated lipoprotein
MFVSGFCCKEQWLMKGIRQTVASAALVILVGCSGQTGTAIDSTGAGDTSRAAGASTSTTGEDGWQEGSEFGGGKGLAGAALDNRVIYFEYNQADVLPEFNAVLEAHGAYLAANPAVRLRLEGHADERGSREYNIGLGERRAQTVRQILMLQGVAAVQLSTVSYGEERPAVLGSDEEAWALNRRVELVYSE